MHKSNQQTINQMRRQSNNHLRCLRFTFREFSEWTLRHVHIISHKHEQHESPSREPCLKNMWYRLQSLGIQFAKQTTIFALNLMMIQSSKIQSSENNRSHEDALTSWLVVHHILGCCTEFLVALDDLIDSIEEVLFCHRFPAGTDGIHPSFCANTPYIRSWSNKQGNVRTWSSIKRSSSKTNQITENIMVMKPQGNSHQ